MTTSALDGAGTAPGSVAGPAGPDVVLQVRGLSVSFGGLRAVDGVDLSLRRDTVLGLIGPNGAGKSTLLDGVSGFVRARGSVALRGRRIEGLPAHRRVRAGLARTFQTSDTIHDLTVADMLRTSAPGWRPDAGAEPATGGGHRAAGLELLEQTLDHLDLRSTLARTLIELPSGVRRLVGVAVAVAMAPVVLMLDEPAAGLTTLEMDELTEAVHFLRDHGLGILVVDHNVGFIARTCASVHMLHLGKIVFSGTPQEMLRSDVVDEVYLGRGDRGAE